MVLLRFAAGDADFERAVQQAHAEFADGEFFHGVENLGSDLGERIEDEAAIPAARVRQREPGMGKHFVPVKEQIQIERPRPPMFRALAAVADFGRLQMVQQFQRRAGHIEFGRRV